MRLLLPLLAFLATCRATDEAPAYSESATISYQFVTADSAVHPLAEISYDLSSLLGEVTSFDAPDSASESSLLRIGVYDTQAKRWKSSTSIASADNFNKGFAPVITLSLGLEGSIISVSVKSGRIDAGKTRDFGPKVKLVAMTKGKAPELNRPVALSKEGKIEQPVVEKTFLQKYWMLILGVLAFTVLSGGSGEK